MTNKNTLRIIGEMTYGPHAIRDVQEITPEETEAAIARAAAAPAVAYLRCISNEGGFDGEDWHDLMVGKIYKILGVSKRLAGWLRVVDDSSEDYLYPPECFEAVIDS